MGSDSRGHSDRSATHLCTSCRARDFTISVTFCGYLGLRPKDAASGIACGIKQVFPDAQQRDDYLHVLYDMTLPSSGSSFSFTYDGSMPTTTNYIELDSSLWNSEWRKYIVAR